MVPEEGHPREARSVEEKLEQIRAEKAPVDEGRGEAPLEEPQEPQEGEEGASPPLPPPELPPPDEPEALALVPAGEVEAEPLVAEGDNAEKRGVDVQAKKVRRTIADAMYRILHAYTRQVERRPKRLMLLFTLIVAALIAVNFRFPEVEFDFSTFIRADGDAALRKEALGLALQERKGPNSRRLTEADYRDEWPGLVQDDSGDFIRMGDGSLEAVSLWDGAEFSDVSHKRRLQGGSLLIYTRELTIIYDAGEGKSVLDHQVLQTIRDFELQMRRLSGWQRLCSERTAPDLTYKCDPGESLMAFAYPTQEKSPEAAESVRFRMQMDANSVEPIPMPAALAFLERGGHELFDLSRFFVPSYQPPLKNGTGLQARHDEPQLLRSRFYFCFDVTGATQAELSANIQSIKLEWVNFISEELYPVVRTGLAFGKDSEGGTVRAFYAGDFLTGHELVFALQTDLLYAIGSISCVLLCLWFQTQSLFISCACLFIIILAVPLAYVMTPAEKLTITSFLALFLVVGIGSDTVFVYCDFWDQEHKQSLHDRLTKVMLAAGKNCLATTLTTAASFLANLESVLQPLREFGLFMGLCVIFVFVLVSMYLPPLLTLQEQARIEAERLEAEDAEDAEIDAVLQAPTSLASIVPVAPTSSAMAESAKIKPKKRRTSAHLLRKWLAGLERRIEFCPGVIMVFSILFVVLFIIGISVDVSVATGVPELFPIGHNQVQMPLLEAKFSALPGTAVTSPSPNLQAAVCSIAPMETIAISRNSCRLHWCDMADPVESLGGDSWGWDSWSWDSEATQTESDSATATEQHDCWSIPPVLLADKQTVLDISQCSSVQTRVRIAAAAPPSTSEARLAMEDMAKHQAGERFVDITESASVKELSALVTESWSTGQVVTTRYFDLGSYTSQLADHNTETTTPMATTTDVNSTNTSEGESSRLLSEGLSNQKCYAEAFCFKAVPQCYIDGFVGLGLLSPSRRLSERSKIEELQLPEERRLANGELLFTPSVPKSKRFNVCVVWGIRAPRSTPKVGPNPEKWSHDPNFEMSNPWAQRAVFAMCNDMPEDLLIYRRICWVNGFQSYLTLSRGRFPTRTFDTQILQYSNLAYEPQEQLWLEDGVVKAVMLQFYVDVAYDIGAERILDYKAKWDKWVDTKNDFASATADFAWHSAGAWTMAEAEVAIINSTIITIIIAVGSGWGCILLFTGDPSLALMVVCLVMGVIIALAFFMVVLQGWEIGPIEVISLVVFVGYAVTYSLHVAHLYGEVEEHDEEQEEQDETPEQEPEQQQEDAKPLALKDKTSGDESAEDATGEGQIQEAPQTETAEQRAAAEADAERRERTRKAVERIGVSLTSSMLSTSGASVFLLAAQMTVFTKLGSVVMAVSVLSCFSSLTVLPAALILLGPGRAPWYSRLLNCVRNSRWRIRTVKKDELEEEEAGKASDEQADMPEAAGRVLE